MRHYTHLHIESGLSVGDVKILEGISWVVYKKVGEDQNVLAENGLVKVKVKEEIGICVNPRKIVLESDGARLWTNSDSYFDGYIHPLDEVVSLGSLTEVYLK